MKVINFRCDEDFYKEVSSKAAAEHTTLSDYIKKAIVDYMYKDVNIPNELLGCIEQCNSNVNKSNKQFSLFYSLFIYFLNYFFAVNRKEMNSWCTGEDKNKNVEKKFWSKESKEIYVKQIDEGKKTTESFIKAFMSNPTCRKQMDVIFANLLEEEVKEEEVN